MLDIHELILAVTFVTVSFCSKLEYLCNKLKYLAIFCVTFNNIFEKALHLLIDEIKEDLFNLAFSSVHRFN